MNYKFYITTLGCPKNEADSREMEISLLKKGLVKSSSLQDAHFHIINTCSFIEEAKKETIDVIFEAHQFRKKNKDQKLIVAGCFSERYKKQMKEIPEIDFHFGTGLYHRAGDLIIEHFQIPKQNIETTEFYSNIIKKNKFYAPIKISDGCNRNCSFCAIPIFRGKFQSREIEDIVNETKNLTNRGIKEILLVSQDSNSFAGGDISKFIELLERLEELENLYWLRLLYLYPDQRTKKIINEISKKKFKKLVPYLESPVQHVSEKILKSMNRTGNYDFFKELFIMARELIPELEIRTTFLIGFPEETSEDIDLILQFLNEVPVEHIHFFAYSREEGTKSYSRKKQIPQKEILNRLNLIQEEYKNIQRRIMSEKLGKIYKCILEKVSPEELYFRRPQSAPEIDDMVIVPYSIKSLKSENKSIPRPGEFYDVELKDILIYDYIGKLQNLY